MKVLIALDSFKGSLSSLEAGEAAAKGILKAIPNAEIVIKPLADGGEGTTQTLVEGLDGKTVEVTVKNPIGIDITATYGIIGDTAVIEMAQASGLTLISPEELDPFKTNTYGTGQMILDALKRGIRKFIIGIGGSATTEGGIGMLSALGVEFFDNNDNLLPPLFDSLGKINRISLNNLPEELFESSFEIACDVTNPLCGPQGSIAVFGKQKGVKPDEIEAMDRAMKNFAEATFKTIGVDNSFKEGAGAAGGLGFAFLSFFPNVSLNSGMDIISKATGLKEELKNTDIVLTGEGRIDSQTVMGKGPGQLAQLAKENEVSKVIAIAGSISNDLDTNNQSFDGIFSILREPVSLKEAMDPKRTKENIQRTVEQIFNLLK